MKRLGSFDLLGQVVNVRVSTPLDEPLSAALAGLSCRSNRRAPVLTVEQFADGEWSVAWRREQRYSGPDESMAFADALDAVTDAAAHHGATDGSVGLYGGAVNIEGQALALVGGSGAGKSTLTAALVQAGHGYIADGVTAVATSGAAPPVVSPFHGPIGLRLGGAAALGLEVPVGPFDQTFPLDARSVGRQSGPTPLHAIAFVEYAAEAEPTIEPISPAFALHRLSNQTLGTWGLESETFRRLEVAVKHVESVVIRYGSIADGVALAERAMPVA